MHRPCANCFTHSRVFKASHNPLQVYPGCNRIHYLVQVHPARLRFSQRLPTPKLKYLTSMLKSKVSGCQWRAQTVTNLYQPPLPNNHTHTERSGLAGEGVGQDSGLEPMPGFPPPLTSCLTPFLVGCPVASGLLLCGSR